MAVPGKDRVVPLAQHGLEPEPVLEYGRVVPQGLVDEHDRPAGVGEFGQRLLNERELFLLGPGSGQRLVRAHHPEEFGVQHQEQHITVHETVVGRPEACLPCLGHQGVVHVVVAGHVEERRLEPGDQALELVPLAFDLRRILRVALDEVADADHERGLENVDLRYGGREHTGPCAACPVADDREVEIAVRVVGIEPRPGPGPVFRLHVDAGSGGRAAGGEAQAGNDEYEAHGWVTRADGARYYRRRRWPRPIRTVASARA